MTSRILKKGETPEEFHTQLYDRITKIEVEILEKIQKLKTNKKTFQCEHLDVDGEECQPYDPSINYYDKFWKRFMLNEIGKQNIENLKEQMGHFSRKLVKIDVSIILFSLYLRSGNSAWNQFSNRNARKYQE